MLIELFGWLFKAFRESRAFCSLVAILGFVAAGVFLTKSGDVGQVIKILGRDSECLSSERLEAITACCRSALRAFGPRFVVQSFFRKRSNPDLEGSGSTNKVFREAEESRLEYLRGKGATLFSYEAYLVVMVQPKSASPSWGERLLFWLLNPLKALGQAFSVQRRAVVLDAELEASIRTLDQAVNSFLEQTADVLEARRLTNEETFAFLRTTLNPNLAKARAVRLVHDDHADYFAVDSELECYPDHLRLDSHYIKTLTLKQIPAKTYADMLGGLFRVRADMMFVTEWSVMDSADAAAMLRSKRVHWHNLKRSIFSNLGSERESEREILYDESKEALVDDLGKGLTAIEMHGVQFGHFSGSIVIYAASLEEAERATAEVMKAVGVHDGAMNEERYNGLCAFLAALPAGHPYNLRRQIVTNENYVDMLALFMPAAGDVRNAFLNAPALAILETEDQSLFHLNLHEQDVAHTLVLGRTGTGKSFLLNFLITHAQQYDPYTFIFDVGGSYRSLVELLGGSYVQFRPDIESFKINSFSLEPTPANLEFQFAFVKLLTESGGYRMKDSEEREVFEAIQSVYMLDRAQRRLLSLLNMVPRTVAEHLRRWTGREQYGRWFDNELDTVSLSRIQCVDFEGMERLPVVREAGLFYLLHRINDVIYDPALAAVFKACVFDEAWMAFKHPVTLAYITNALRTWRKKNAAMILATQSIEDLASADAFRSVIESCPTKLLLANPSLDSVLYSDALRLNANEQERVRTLKGKKQFLLKREGFAKTLSLNVDPKSYWLFTTNPYESQRRQELINQHGLKAALEILAGGKQ